MSASKDYKKKIFEIKPLKTRRMICPAQLPSLHSGALSVLPKTQTYRQNQHDRRFLQNAVSTVARSKKMAIKNTKTCARDAVHKAVCAPKRTATRQEKYTLGFVCPKLSTT